MKVTKILVLVDLLTFEPLKINFFLLIDLFYFDFIILSTFFLNNLVVTNVNLRIYLFV